MKKLQEKIDNGQPVYTNRQWYDNGNYYHHHHYYHYYSTNTIIIKYWNCNFPMTRSVRLVVGRLLGWLFGALVNTTYHNYPQEKFISEQARELASFPANAWLLLRTRRKLFIQLIHLFTEVTC